jgi:hypothetical protein
MPVHLISRRPSPTTASFTVSNASRHTSTPAKLFSYFQFLLRGIVFAGVLSFHAARFRHAFFSQDSFVPWSTVWSSSLGVSLCRIADTTNFAVAALASVLVLYGVFLKGYTGMSTLCEAYMNRSLIFTRGVPSRYPRPGHSDVHIFAHLSIQSCDEIHPDYGDPGYCHT